MIVGLLFHDTPSLLACLSTCRRFRLAAIPHLYVTLYELYVHFDSNSDEGTLWPAPLGKASALRYLHSLTSVVISGNDRGFAVSCFNMRNRRRFSRLTRVRALSIINMDVASFIPQINRYFEQFSRTLRSLSLSKAGGSSQDLVFFIKFFPQLEDLELDKCHGEPRWTIRPDLTLIPKTVRPPLRGRFAALNSSKVVATVMVDALGELTFHHMNLSGPGVQILLFACADALEMLELHALDICGEWPLQKRCEL